MQILTPEELPDKGASLLPPDLDRLFSDSQLIGGIRSEPLIEKGLETYTGMGP
jgi:hypothetical protein